MIIHIVAMCDVYCTIQKPNIFVTFHNEPFPINTCQNVHESFGCFKTKTTVVYSCSIVKNRLREQIQNIRNYNIRRSKLVNKCKP